MQGQDKEAFGALPPFFSISCLIQRYVQHHHHVHLDIHTETAENVSRLTYQFNILFIFLTLIMIKVIIENACSPFKQQECLVTFSKHGQHQRASFEFISRQHLFWPFKYFHLSPAASLHSGNSIQMIVRQLPMFMCTAMNTLLLCRTTVFFPPGWRWHN